MKNKIIYVVIGVIVLLIIITGIYFVNMKQNNYSNNYDASTLSKFDKYSAEDVINIIQKENLPMEEIKDQTIGSGENIAPATEIESKKFIIPSISPYGGQILIFKDEAGLKAKKAWFDKFPEFAPYVFTNGNTMLQLNSGLPALEAIKYQEALNKLN